MSNIVVDTPLFELLTPRQQAFIQHPEVMIKPEKAAIEVGYSAKTARTRAHMMRKQLIYYIQPLNAKRAQQAGVTPERVRDTIGIIANAKITDYFDTIDVEGDTVKVYVDPALLPDHMQQAIKSISFDTIVDNQGNETQVIKEIQLFDKSQALRELAEILGLKDARMRHPDGNIQEEQALLLEHLEPRELDLIQRLYRRAAKRAEAAADKKRDATAIPGSARRIRNTDDTDET